MLVAERGEFEIWGHIAPLGMRSNRIVLARSVQEKAGGLPPFKSVLSVFVSTPAIILTAKQTALAQDMMYVGLLAVLCPLDAKPSRHAIHRPVSVLMRW